MIDKKIVYVNYSPYENQGNILNFLLEEYTYIFLFSIGHHNLGKNQKINKLTIYENKKIKKEIHLYHLYASPRFVFIIIPFRSLLNLFQMIWQCQKLKNEYGNLDIYFTVNGFTAWVGLVLRRLGLVTITAYWVCDYYPNNYKSRIIRSMRWLYWQFEKRTTSTDILTFHNNRIVDIWKKKKLLPKDYKPTLIPIGTAKNVSINKNKKHEVIRLCFLGVLKKSMGLDYVFDSADLLSKNFPGLIIEIIGPGPDTEYFKKMASNSNITYNFYGYMGEEEVEKIISSSTIGIAPYTPDPTQVSYYADSAKMKKYISLGLPVIATKVHEFSEEIEKYKAGVVVEYGNATQLVNAIKVINTNYKSMLKNVMKLNNKYYYKNIYPKMFELNKKKISKI